MVIFVAAAILYGLAACQDLVSRTIPNLVPAALVLLGLARWSFGGHWADLAWAAAYAGLAFACLFVIFARGWLGGGDVKLIVATLLLIGAAGALPFLMLMSLIGGLLVPATLVWSRLKHRIVSIPYGLAISAAAVWCLATDPVTPIS